MTANERASLVTVFHGAAVFLTQMSREDRYHIRDIFAREIQAAIDEAVESAATIAHKHALPALADEIRALSKTDPPAKPAEEGTK